MISPSIKVAAVLFLFGAGSHPLMSAGLERPTPPTPGTAVPAPGQTPARVIGAERTFRAGASVVHVLPAPSDVGPGEWSDELQPPMFRAYLTRAPRE